MVTPREEVGVDLIGTLAERLGVEAGAAEALAGAVLGAAREQAGAEETAQLEQAVPEIDAWKATADTVLEQGGGGSGGLLGGLARMAGSGVGNDLLGAVLGDDAQETATVVALMSRLGLEPQHATLAAPVVLDFLEDRLGATWTDRVVKSAPLLLALVDRMRDTG